jgi:hypothetical protein
MTFTETMATIHLPSFFYWRYPTDQMADKRQIQKFVGFENSKNHC